MLRPRSRKAGLSLAELLIVIAVIGIFSAVGIQSYSGLRLAGREGVARDTVELLNRGVQHFNQTNWDLVLNPVANTTTDELAVLRTLQWRNPDPTLATPGSPFVSETVSQATSNSPRDFRIQWNGRNFELLLPGEAGAGLLVAPEGATVNPSYTYPEGYQPLGPGQHE